MANVQNKENMTIAIREYTDGQGQQKKVWKTIGELITWDDGSKSFELWGPTGSTKGNVFAKDNDNQQQQPQQQQAPQQAPQQYQQPNGQPMNPQQVQQQNNGYQQP
ncbi:MAG: hypothetical protein COB12_12065 [Flavobacterium sp.]|nr:MAG: hypothetical protein COB12_12065 [Flavobacterium sp.]